MGWSLQGKAAIVTGASVGIGAEVVRQLVAQGARYLYFIDEIFLPWRELLEALAARALQFGVQTRIDLWKPEMLERLGEVLDARGAGR